MRSTTKCGMSHIAVRRIEGDSGRYYVLPVAEVLYVFLRNAVHRNRVQIRQYDGSALTKDGVYVRTAKGVFLSTYRTLLDLKSRLGDKWLKGAQGVVVNVKRLAWVEVRGQHRLACLVQPEQEPDCLLLSRNAARAILAHLGVRRRKRTRSDREGR